MVHRWLKVMLALVLVFSMASQSFAQNTVSQQSAAQGAEGKGPAGGPRRHLATIIFAGLGGAVLGLSSLSFYGRPQEKLANIAIGFAFGIIVGTAFVTYKAATSPAEFYGTASVWGDPNQPARPWIEIERSQQLVNAPGSSQTPLALSFSRSF